MRVIFTPLAERHIDNLHEYITTHANEERADSYVGRIVEFCIAFVVTGDAMLIEGILYGGQDLRGAFRDQT